MPRLAPLPIDEVLEPLVRALRDGSSAVLLAPPGAGKTTRVPQALIDRAVVPAGQRVLVLEPRRLAARMAAQRIADERGVRLGDEVGYQVRFDDRTSARTRIAILTEGILTRRLESDPLLEGVGAVVLDEFHERSIHADLALAFLREIQETVRPELKVVVMSATFDPAPVARFLGGCPVLRSEGRAFPVEVVHLERADERPVVEALVSGVRRAVREVEQGDVLAFLPGAGEIRRAKAELDGHLEERVEVHQLFGELDAAAQDRAVRPGPRRKVILATNIAESALTIEGVTTVVDGGWQKLDRFDPALGIDRLELVRISQRSAAQRAGRAGRLGPGRAYRLWSEKEGATLALDDPPEIARVDLAPVLLDVLRWSATDPRAFRWFEAPPEAMVSRALELLRALGALPPAPGSFQLTPLGARLAQLPLHPRLARLLVRAHELGLDREGARLAALASERDLVRRGPERRDARLVGTSDLLDRAERLAELEAHGLSRESAARLGIDLGTARTVLRTEERLRELSRRALGDAPARPRGEDPDAREQALLRVVLAGYPDRVGRRRSLDDDRVVLVGGGSAKLARESVVQASELMVAVELDAGARGRESWLRVASQIEPAWLEQDGAGVRWVHGARWNPSREAAEAVKEKRYFDLLLEERPDSSGSPEALARVLAEAARQDLDRALPITDEVSDLLHRHAFVRRAMPELGWAPLGPEARLELLEALTEGRRSFQHLQALDLAAAIRDSLPYEQQQALDRFAPRSVPIPSGRAARLRYPAEGPPVLSVRLQEVFGLYATPRVADRRVPVKMELLAPNQRPVQVTQDLESFWASTYAEVRKELRRRYPKHQWPEDPREGIATAKVRPPPRK